MTKTDFEQQTEELARQLQWAIDHYDDPDQVAARAAYEADKDTHQRAVFEELYLQTGQRDPSVSLEVSVAKMARYFADQLDAHRSADTQPLPALDTGEEMRLQLARSADSSALELHVERRDGKRAKHVLSTGSERDLIAFLRASAAAQFIVLFAQKLATELSPG